MDQTEQFADLARRFLLKDLHNVSLNLGKRGIILFSILNFVIVISR